jgi:hypothetical protein
VYDVEVGPGVPCMILITPPQTPVPAAAAGSRLQQ